MLKRVALIGIICLGLVGYNNITKKTSAIIGKNTQIIEDRSDKVKDSSLEIKPPTNRYH